MEMAEQILFWDHATRLKTSVSSMKAVRARSNAFKNHGLFAAQGTVGNLLIKY